MVPGKASLPFALEIFFGGPMWQGARNDWQAPPCLGHSVLPVSSLMLKSAGHPCVQLCLETLVIRWDIWGWGHRSPPTYRSSPVTRTTLPGYILWCLPASLPWNTPRPAPPPPPMGPGLDQSLSNWRHRDQTHWEAFSDFSFYIQSFLLGTSFMVFIIREVETPHSPPGFLPLQPCTYCWGAEEFKPSCRTRVYCVQFRMCLCLSIKEWITKTTERAFFLLPHLPTLEVQTKLAHLMALEGFRPLKMYSKKKK